VVGDCVASADCGDPTLCGTDQQCIAEACVPAIAASSVARCVVLPPAGVLNAGGARVFSAISYDSHGNEIAYAGPVDFAILGVTGATARPLAASAGSVTVTGTSALSSSTGSVTATIGSLSCTPAALSAFAAPPAHALRVTVADESTGTPLVDAVVVDGSGNVLTPQGDGTYTETDPQPGARNTFSAFRVGYSAVTFVDTSATDVFIPLAPAVAPGTFTGMLSDRDFRNLSIETGTVHIAFSSSGIAGNLTDASLSTLVGQLVPSAFDLGGTTATNVNLPEGLVLGVGPTMDKASETLVAPPGVHALWTFGGNVPLQIVLNAVSMATGGNVDVGAILTSVVPILGELNSGIAGGVAVTPGEQGTLSTTGTNAGTNAVLTLDTLLRLHLSATVPDLPAYALPTDAPGTPTGQLNAVAVVGGVLATGGQGFVPLGFSAGVSDTAQGKPSQIAGALGGPDGVIPLRIAAPSGGLENGQYMAIAVAADLNTLGGHFGGSSSAPPVLSANVILPGAINAGNGATTDLMFPGAQVGASSTFLGLPVQPAFALATRTLSLPSADVPGVAFHRLLIGGNSNAWEIYFPPGEASVQVPALPGGFTGSDPLHPAGGAPTLTLQSVTLGLNGDNTGIAYSYDDVVAFQTGGPTVDNLTLQMDQFSIEGVPVQ
jgi:hypothetical protein